MSQQANSRFQSRAVFVCVGMVISDLCGLSNKHEPHDRPRLSTGVQPLPPFILVR
jgi:hypothetical protein